MLTNEHRRLGAQIRATTQRQQALDGYYRNPNRCEHCQEVIRVPDGGKVKHTRRLRFCSKSCAAIKNNKSAPKRIRNVPICVRCETNPVQSRPSRGYNTLCSSCWAAERERVLSLTKSEISARSLRLHARYVLRKERPELTCDWCSYDKHVECCHLQGVAIFSDDTPVSVINDPKNLRWLCPNCHWELDHGLRGDRQ